MTALAKENPGSVEVLRLQIALAMLPPAKGNDDPADAAQRRNEADEKIQTFLDNYPKDVSAKRFWVEWLIRTGRSEEALAYLNDPKNFPGERDDITKRMTGMLLLSRGKQEEGLQVLQQLPRDKALEFMIIQATANPTLKEKSVREAIGRYENNGLFRIWEGERLLTEKKYDEAANTFWQSFEFNAVNMAAHGSAEIHAEVGRGRSGQSFANGRAVQQGSS